ncbi:MAG TPA: alkaline phosphatase D family protein [Aquabacterium sp.]|uniref:alkaline phosphatase D family protein n=1 Tax=Aquabacterium sp. TaxID=1872578 RepID=UPI002E31D9EF|nr:alkaline phosphatase D family protein [Aquabacterium sp.]HEX5354755.1 alkaline phosphatase D family protein [Aquabacterium sp.]
MSNKAPPFGAVSIRAPQLPEVQATKIDPDQNTVMIKLGYEPTLSTPLFAGVIPAQYMGLPEACSHARYAPWIQSRTLPVADFKVDVDWSKYPGAEWLVYIVYAQPHEFANKDLEQAIPDRTFMELAAVAALFRKMEGRYKNSQDAIDDVVRAVRAAERETLIGPEHIKLNLPRLRDVPTGAVRLQAAIEFAENDDAPKAPAPSFQVNHKAPAWDALPTRFLLTSCLYPGGILDRTPQLAGAVSPSERTLSLIAQAYVPIDSRPDFVLMLGDQVYVDATAGLFDPQVADGRHFDPYIQWQRSDCVRRVVREARMESMIDDHELADNWSPVANDATSLQDDGSPGNAHQYVAGLKDSGLRSYRAYRFDRSGTANTDGLHGPVGPDHQRQLVFMANTRTEREVRNSLNIDQARIMSAPQWAELSTWLQAVPKDAWRFLASPSMVLPRRIDACGATPASALRSDAWDGYPASLHALLAHICERGLHKLVLLSGDEHLASISRITLRKAGSHDEPALETVIHSVHAPAMYAPYPFANARPDDFSQRRFSFAAQAPAPGDLATARTTPYTCDVETWFPEMGDGFVVIESPAETDDDQRLKLRLASNNPDIVITQMPDWLNRSEYLSVQIDKYNAASIIV